MSDKPDPSFSFVHAEQHVTVLKERDTAVSQRDRLYKGVQMLWESREPVQIDGEFVRVRIEPLKYLVAMLPREDDDV